MKKRRRVLWIVLGVGLAAAVSMEDYHRRMNARRYQEALLGRRQLEQRVVGILASHDRLRAELDQERQRSTELSSALSVAREQVEQTTGRLAQETQQVRDLKLRLSAVQRQMDQVQGELAMALRRSPIAEEPSAPAVQLERIVVSRADAPQLRGRIVSVHEEWNFVVIDLGWNAVKIGDVVSIVRSDQMLAKARIDRVQEGVSAATILPESNITDIHINDAVQIL